MTLPQYSVIVVYHQNSEELRACLRSIPPPAEVVLVDTSPDQSGVPAQCPDRPMTFIPAPENYGYGWGVNLGLARASGRVKVVCNSDVIFEAGSLDELVEIAGGPIPALVAPIQCESGTETLDNVQPGLGFGVSLARWCGIRSRALRKARRGALNSVMAETGSAGRLPERFSLSGACLAAADQTWARLQGFDERIFLYHEDVDISVRARQLGIAILLAPVSRVQHVSGTNRRPLNLVAMSASVWGEQIVMRTHRPDKVLLLMVVQVLGCLARATIALVRRDLPACRAWVRCALLAGRRVDSDPRSANALSGAQV